MKILLFLIVLSSTCISCLLSQTPQFAIVKPNGTTSIYPTWTAAYSAALNDDNLYLPGIVISGSITIDKRIHIYGAGHHPDSTLATGKTLFSSSITITSGASGGSIEGVAVSSGISLGGSLKLHDFLIKRCYCPGSLYFQTTNNPDSVTQNCTIMESVFNGITASSSSCPSINNLFTKNIFTGTLTYVSNSVFKNNIFTYGNYTINIVNNSLFENNVFLAGNPIYSFNGNQNCYNSYLNNLKLYDTNFYSNPSCPNQSVSGNIMVPSIDSIFISYANNGFQYSNNYHLKLTCPGVGAGTDGTDVGIYGTNNPTPAGWIPSNPHIFFKQIDSETGSDGKLHIQVGVRTNNQEP